MGPEKPDLLARLDRPPKNIAIVCASRIGDFICATPAFRALKKMLPESCITLIGLPFVQEMVERNTHLEKFEAFPGFPGIAEQFFDARNVRTFICRMQRRRYDLAIQVHGSGIYSNTFTLLLGARFTAGFVRDGNDTGLLDAALCWPSLHASVRALSLVEFLGAPRVGNETEFDLLPEDFFSADRLLRACPEPFIGLHPWSREPEKVWPLDRFAEVAAELRQSMGGTPVILGGPDEGIGGERIKKLLRGRACNLAGRKSVAEMGAIISKLKILITNDSGPAHIAYARGTPSVTLFGKTDPQEWGPPSGAGRHRVLRAPDCSLSSIMIDGVVQAAMEAVESRDDARPKKEM